MNGSGPAGIVSRAIAGVVDVLMAVVICGALVLGTALVDAVLDPRTLALPLRLPWEVSAVSFLVIAAVYLAFCWGTGGRTVGGALMGTRLRAKGGRPGWVTACLRAGLCAVFPIGLLWVVVDRDRRSLQDRLLGTSVVYDEPALVRTDRR
ncbi:RDD family protein [Nakamurella flavida]|uniref:RDD family protein n=1 Tax=Nakamurella flavida TaxID=363630 RepID=A0A938YSK5_9ACTN|nr:RDD family protein [Nakamurella flavida]MBM9478105.1 RDD family protein [Nakamurella flavida]MDP9778674.1 putative RDD family membrane protein YckC [Nakamurella flavida]